MITEKLFKKYAKVYAGENDQLNMDYKSFTLLMSEIKQLSISDVSNCKSCGIEINYKGVCDVCYCKGIDAYKL